MEGSGEVPSSGESLLDTLAASSLCGGALSFQKSLLPPRSWVRPGEGAGLAGGKRTRVVERRVGKSGPGAL